MTDYMTNPNWLNGLGDPNLNGSLPNMPPPDYSYAPNDLPANMQPGWMTPGQNTNLSQPANPSPPNPYGLPSSQESRNPGTSTTFGGGPGRLGAGQLNRPDIFNPNMAPPYTSPQPQPGVARPGQDNVDSLGTGYAPLPTQNSNPQPQQQMPPGYGLNRTEGVGFAPNPPGPQPMPVAPDSQRVQYSDGSDQQGMRKYLTPDQPVGQPQQMPRLQMPVGLPPQAAGNTQIDMNDPAVRQRAAEMAARAQAARSQGGQMLPGRPDDFSSPDPAQAEALRQRYLAQLQQVMSQAAGRPQPAFTPTSNQRLNINPYGDNNP